MELTDRLTPLMYMSKACTFHQCPKKYYWQHHLWIQTKQRPSYFSFGSAFHKIVECGLRFGWDAAETFATGNLPAAQALKADLSALGKLDDVMNLIDKDRTLILDMFDAFRNKWTSERRTVFSIEKSILHPIKDQSVFFDSWVAKADAVFSDADGVWVGDWKTTSGYGASTAKYYHSSPQTKTYFHVLQGLMPSLIGTKIFVITKKAIRCEIEAIHINDADHYQAELFINDTLTAVDRAEELFNEHGDPDSFPRCMSACINSFGMECPYIPLCINQVRSSDYIPNLIENWYTISSPDEHLELEGE